MSLASRLKERREQLGLKQSDIAAQLGITPGAVGNYENGVSTPRADILFRVFDVLQCDANYLFQDEMKSNFPMKVSYDEMENIKKYRSLDPFGKETVDWILNRELERKDQSKTVTAEIYNTSDSPVRFIQYYRKVSAGTGEVIYEDTLPEQITIPAIPKYRRVAYAVKVDGRSMEPRYNDGDMLLIEPTCSIDVGEIGIFNVDGKAYVKKLGEAELISLNRGYKNIPLTHDSRCMGRVIDKLTV